MTVTSKRSAEADASDEAGWTDKTDEMNIFISGGAKNGKSMFAQKTAYKMAEEHGRPLYYVATMIPKDCEDEARIARHIREREGWGFTTIERGQNIAGLLEKKTASGSRLRKKA